MSVIAKVRNRGNFSFIFSFVGSLVHVLNGGVSARRQLTVCFTISNCEEHGFSFLVSW